MKENGRYDRTASLKALKMCTENINLQYRNNFHYFSIDQNTTEFYDNHILLTVIFIFWLELGLKQHYFELSLMENGKVF